MLDPHVRKVLDDNGLEIVRAKYEKELKVTEDLEREIQFGSTKISLGDVEEWLKETARSRTSISPPFQEVRPEPAPVPEFKVKVIAALHGIRTIASWQRTLSDATQAVGWRCPLEVWNYGRFSFLRFLIPKQRETKIRWFRNTYTNFMRDRSLPIDDDNLPSIVAHSFGTYILGYSLLKYENIKFDKVILCGSILPQEFPWNDILDRGQVTAVLNEFGSNDIWSKIVHWVIAGTGASGQRGFWCRHGSLIQKQFLFHHSEYFERGHMEENWLGFVGQEMAGRPRTSLPAHRPRPNIPWGLYTIYLIIVVTLAIFFAPWINQVPKVFTLSNDQTNGAPKFMLVNMGIRCHSTATKTPILATGLLTLITSDDQLYITSIKSVLNNPEMMKYATNQQIALVQNMSVDLYREMIIDYAHSSNVGSEMLRYDMISDRHWAAYTVNLNPPELNTFVPIPTMFGKEAKTRLFLITNEPAQPELGVSPMGLKARTGSRLVLLLEVAMSPKLFSIDTQVTDVNVAVLPDAHLDCWAS